MSRGLLSVLLLFLTVCSANAIGPVVVERHLANGARLLVSEQRNLPMVVVGIMLDAGSRWDRVDRAGVANLTAELLTEGTKSRKAATIKEEIDALGGAFGAQADADYTVVEMRVLKTDLARGVDLLSDVLLHPTFAETELARRKEAVLAQIRSQRDDPTHVAELAFARALFGDGPYGHPLEGTESTVKAITQKDVREFYARYYRPVGATIVVVGDIDAAEAETIFGAALATWSGNPAAPPAGMDAPAPTVVPIRINKAVTQAAIFLGHRGVARNNPDYEAISVMNYILGGGGFSSRLMDNIRTKAGLAYSVASYFSVSKDVGSFAIVMQTKNASVADAINRARGEMQRIRETGVTDAEVDEAKRYLTGSFALRLDSMSEIARFIAQVTAFGLGLDYADRYLASINAVTTADVQRVAQQYVHPDELTEVIVADLSEATLPSP